MSILETIEPHKPLRSRNPEVRQCGIFPCTEKLLVPRVDPYIVRVAILKLEKTGITYPQIAAIVKRDPHHVYVVCRNCGRMRYRTDNYVRPKRSMNAA